MMKDLASQYVLVGRHVGGGFPLNAIMPRRLHPAEQSRSDGRGNLVLDSEDVLKLAIVAFGPDMRLSLGVDELNRDPDPISRLADASFGDVVHSKFKPDLLRLDVLTLVDEHGLAGDHEQFAETRQL